MIVLPYDPAWPGYAERALAETYTRAKTALIQRMVDTARTARGLPPVGVWEE